MATQAMRGKVAQQQPLARQREARALRLRMGGKTFDAIGRALGVTEGAAQRAYFRALERLSPVADREEQRALEAARLDRMMARPWAAALRGDAKSIESVLAIMARRARLLGLDAPAEPANLTIILLQQIQRRVAALSDDDLLEILGYDGTGALPGDDALPPADP